ncbi:alpha/beta hydrolase [uncultured Mitsuokella sp.]|uniref:alpha/beta hydrolase n=1 Tax=Mitsuokella sp. AF33-22 TaxID=2292047 RepID=UPI00345BEA4F
MSGAEPFFLPGGRTGVLLIHGFTGLPAELLLMGKYLQAQGCTVLGVRLAGHGTTAEDMSHMTGEDWLDSVRDGYALLRGCCDHVVAGGHSMGGLLALLLAAEQEVMGVISMSAPIYIAEERGIAKLPPRRLCAGVFVPKARRRLRNVPPAVNQTYRSMPLTGVHELLGLMERTKQALPSIRVPALILHSLNDRTADAESAIYIREHLGSSEKEIVWLKTSGHLIPVGEERDQVFAAAAAFLSRLTGSGQDFIERTQRK